jgi:glucose/arabinose dehydrogenase
MIRGDRTRGYGLIRPVERVIVGGFKVWLSIVMFSIVAGSAAVMAPPARGATLPDGFRETRIATGLVAPTAMALSPDGRLFVAEQEGRLRVVEDGALLPTPFVTVSVDSAGERGLLGVAIDPAFAFNQYVYVYYTTASSPIHNRLSRFTANGDVAEASSEVVIMELENLSEATYHNGGAIHFGPDGTLFVAVGDAGDGASSQTLANRLGKILRINPDGTIPSTNPFYGSATGENRSIWALGLRNPFTFSFLQGSSRMFVNDVGANIAEEINDGIAGSNYGWPDSEGPTSDPRFRSPLHSYGHGDGPTSGCAITGGAFYNPSTPSFPADYAGDYFFADFCSGWIRRYDPVDGSATGFATGAALPVDLLVHDDGSLYYLTRGSGGSVFRVAYAPGEPRPAADFDGDGDTDIAIYRSGAGLWAVRGQDWISFGLPDDVPVPADYDGNGMTDIAVFQSGLWAILGQPWVHHGLPDDIPVPADYDGDGRVDIAVFRPASGAWAIRDQPWIYHGLPDDIPVPADYDGDGRVDIAVFRPASGAWAIHGQPWIYHGLPGDIPVPADYDADGRVDIAIFRPASGAWAIHGQPWIHHGLPGDIPVPADYDADGDVDIAVFRPESGLWAIRGQEWVHFGLPGDVPLLLPAAQRT